MEEITFLVVRGRLGVTGTEKGTVAGLGKEGITKTSGPDGRVQIKEGVRRGSKGGPKKGGGGHR